ncbi:hypothetical protein U1Q18_028231, partial [Sarracenia purpurea var. burkii]
RFRRLCQRNPPPHQRPTFSKEDFHVDSGGGHVAGNHVHGILLCILDLGVAKQPDCGDGDGVVHRGGSVDSSSQALARICHGS